MPSSSGSPRCAGGTTRATTTARAVAALFAASVALFAWAPRAEAQQQAQGFAVERLVPSAPGGGWVVMDALDMRGGLGGGVAMLVGYAHNPLRVRSSDGSQHLTVVSDQAFADFGFAVSYDHWRLYLNLDMPLGMGGNDGAVDGYRFSAPHVDLGKNPDSLSDARVGVDARILGGAASPFRLGASAQLIFPNGNRSDVGTDGTYHSNYDTDGTYRAMARVLFAGAVGPFVYAGQVGVHVRPLDDHMAPGGPQGSEGLFGVAGGARILLRGRAAAVIIGPEIYGATAFRSFLGSTGTALEGLLSGRLEGTGDDGPQLRFKVGTGAGLNQRFGAPEWRFVVGIELFDHHSDRDKDGISDSKDACPDTPGIGTSDPKTNGCPATADGGGGR